MCSVTSIFRSQTFTFKFVTYTPTLAVCIHTHFLDSKVGQHGHIVCNTGVIFVRYKTYKQVQSVTGTAKIFLATPNTQISRTDYTTTMQYLEKKLYKDY
jgi:hypothetical protein